MHNGRTVAPSAAKDRAFLGELLAHPGRFVSTDHLADALWPDRLPADPANAVQVRASRLRATLRSLTGQEDGGGVLRTQSGGYALDLDRSATDLACFEAAVCQAEDRPVAAATLLADGLALWRGAPFADVPSTPCVRVQAARSEELRLSAVEAYADLCLVAGPPPASLVADLAEQATRSPLREPLHHRLMRALHLSGRPAEALAVYDTLRATLAEELGTDPHPDLRRLHHEILAAASRAPAASTAPPASTESTVSTGSARSTSLAAPAPPTPPGVPGGVSPPPVDGEQDEPEVEDARKKARGPSRRTLVLAAAGLAVTAGVCGAVVTRLSEPPVVVMPDVLRPIPGDSSRLDADVTYPDGTKVREGARFEKVWQLTNDGTVFWHDRYLDRQLPWDGDDVCRSPRRVRIPDTRPGQSVLVRVPVVAPGVRVRCKVYWKMVDDHGIPYLPQLRGVFFDVQVVPDL
ncbi:BTAD domain-containing putative transcriptional regulator [Planotetraspora kaengkrachanensis]|nr:BTAD domain-containing putative transcriptional regulator [Planotetraspora kaengkrachanensis]